MENKKILVVDDDVNIRNILKQALSMLDDVEVYLYSEPFSLIAEMKENPNPPHLIITDFDFKMPEINGLEFAQVVKTCLPQVPIVMLSGTPPTLAENSPIDLLVEKPIMDLMAFLKTIQNLCIS
jgi:DNA-binding NtrC family response regulator